MTTTSTPPPDYAELHCISNFSFLRGASHPGELVERAARLGYTALALTDECSLAGVVRAHEATKDHPVQLIIGAEFRLHDGPHCVLLATSRRGYGQLASLITLARRRSPKGGYELGSDDLLAEPLDGCLLIWLADAAGGRHPDTLARVAGAFANRAWLGFTRLSPRGQAQELAALETLGKTHGLPLVACGDVHMHARSRRPLQDTLTAIRLGKPLDQLGYALFPNGERHLRPRNRLARLYPPALLEQTVAIARRCDFSLDSLRYEYPHELVPAGHTPASWLRACTERGAARLYPKGIPDKVREQIEHELRLIAELGYEFFFLTVHEIVEWARGRGILCQGRGSAANSTVCYCLGITSVNPEEHALLFERFVSRERGEPPDIDVDFEHERREEVIQHIYSKYGRDRAALAATVISYRPRSAIRDVGKALGMSLDQVDHLARSLQWWDSKDALDARFHEAGLPPDTPVARRLIALVGQIIGFPRHLSQHVGGFVISQGPVHQLCPVENAAMADRTIIQWDKDDLESLGLLKVDVLALGMLTAIRKCFDLIADFHGRQLTLASIPRKDEPTFEMIRAADTVGVFQIESRAQMSMLPRLRPETFYDLVIEVAIVRPGPIQGDMVHPYLNRRWGREPVDYPRNKHGDDGPVRQVLERTLGVPIFQEQVMELAVVAAGFTRGEADALRRAMAAWKRKGGLGPFEAKLKQGLADNGYSAEWAERIFNQIKGFGDYGFPESHSASFALLAYVSAWLKCHYPAAFTTALLNSLPMGFYGPAQLVGDARRHGVAVRPADVLTSDVQSTLEPDDAGAAVIRLGLDRIKGLDGEAAARIVAARTVNPPRPPFEKGGRLNRAITNKRIAADPFYKGGLGGIPTTALTPQQLAAQAALSREHMEALAAAGALKRLSGNRHQAFWDAAGVEAPTTLLGQPQFAEATPLLRSPSEGEDIVADYASLSLTLGRHPLALLRPRLDRLGVQAASALGEGLRDQVVRVAGLVISRQRPGTASGVVFMTLEDETGPANVIVWPKVLERHRRQILGTRLVIVRGQVQHEDNVTHLIAQQVEDVSDWVGALDTRSRNFH